MIPYDKDTVFKKAIEAIKKYRLIHIDKIFAFVGVSKTTFYNYFPKDSDELNAIKEEILNIKIRGAVKMLNKFEDSDDKTLNIAYFKIVCSDEEWKRLSSSQTENKTELSTKKPINLKELFGFESDNP
jgi:hypothetical protein